MTPAELAHMREEGARGLATKRRAAVDAAVAALVESSEREAADAWAQVDRLRAECERLAGEVADWKARALGADARWSAVEDLLARLDGRADLGRPTRLAVAAVRREMGVRP